jgi:hypothetical protein
MEICGTSNSLCQIQDLKLCWPPAKIGTLSTSGASSTQTLPNRLKLDKPTSVNRISVVATPLNRMGQQHLGNCGFVASRMWINMMHSKILYNMWLYISLYIYSTYIHNISNIYIHTYIIYIYSILYIIYIYHYSILYILYNYFILYKNLAVARRCSPAICSRAQRWPTRSGSLRPRTSRHWPWIKLRQFIQVP